MKTFLAHALNITLKALRLLVLLLAALFIFLLIAAALSYHDLKAASDNGLAGKALLTEAAVAAQDRNWAASLEKAKAAEEKFDSALADTEKLRSKALFDRLAPLRSQINDLEYLLQTAEIVSRSLERAIPLAERIDQIRSGANDGNLAKLPTEKKKELLKLVYESEPELNGLKANLNLAVLNLGKIHKIGLLWPIYKQISDIRQELGQAANLMENISPLAKLLPALAGYPEESRFLLIMQNNDELRPTGGFIGVDGILAVKDGEIITLATSDSYHLDMPAVGKWQLTPPAPVKKYLKVENWYLRDANWSPDWPQSARQIETIYRGESAAIGQPVPPFSGVIAINPDLVADLLTIVGPIKVRGEEYNASNFQPLLQYNVEVAYKDQNISSWDRKEIINELLGSLREKLFALPAKRWPELLKAIDRNIAERNLQLFFNDPDQENLARDLGADGEIIRLSDDYLAVIDANLGAFKTDAVVKKSITYEAVGQNGRLQAVLSLGYQHEGGFDWRTTRYRSYTRVYVPLGSKLTSISGLDEATADLSTYDDRELGKTVFGFFFSVEPKSSRNVRISYSLPDTLGSVLADGRYRLLVQKQSGRRTESLKVRLSDGQRELGSWQANLDENRTFSWPNN